MDAAATAINNLLKRAGQENTTVDAEVAPSVEHDTITKTHEENLQPVVEKETHKDYYHTTVQPLTDKEVKPTEHEHKQAPTQHREVEHDNAEATKQKIEAEKAKYQDSVREGATIETKTQEPTVTGEHVHHHLHETIQPVIEKEIIKPTVTHTTVPVHEKHHDESEVLSTSTAAPMSVSAFKDVSITKVHKEHDGPPAANE